MSSWFMTILGGGWVLCTLALSSDKTDGMIGMLIATVYLVGGAIKYELEKMNKE